MGKVDQLVSGLQKLYSKRGALDKQIADAEKKLAVEAKASAKAAPAKKATAKNRQQKRLRQKSLRLRNLLQSNKAVFCKKPRRQTGAFLCAVYGR
jgi:hypothetical protein